MITVDIFEENDWGTLRASPKARASRRCETSRVAGVGGQTHGQHKPSAQAGSLGALFVSVARVQRQTPSGRTGGERVTVLNLRIVKKTSRNNLLLVKGSIPGAKGSYLLIED